MSLPSVLLVATTTGYQVRAFGDAAAALGVRVVLATDRCKSLEDPWRDQAIPVRFHDDAGSIKAVRRAAAEHPFEGVLAVGDRPAALAAVLAEALALPFHPAAAAAASRNKYVSHERLRATGLPVPRYQLVGVEADPAALDVPRPCVVKPLVLSGSRGVIRADDRASFVAAFARVRALLAARDVVALRDPDAGRILVEEYLPGDEYAVEGVVEHGRPRILAVFDKPDPLVGPFFEETIYVTPSRATATRQRQLERAVADACVALGLWHGPIHAECRVDGDTVYVLEVAARPIGGLCARALRFERGGAVASLEELLLRHATGEALDGWVREPQASGVMMIPIPTAGVFRRMEGLEDARAVAGIEDVRITAKPDQRLVPLPEGASYLGFLFARAETPAAVESALREAHRRLRVVVTRLVSVAGA